MKEEINWLIKQKELVSKNIHENNSKLRYGLSINLKIKTENENSDLKNDLVIIDNIINYISK